MYSNSKELFVTLFTVPTKIPSGISVKPEVKTCSPSFISLLVLMFLTINLLSLVVKIPYELFTFTEILVFGFVIKFTSLLLLETLFTIFYIKS